MKETKKTLSKRKGNKKQDSSKQNTTTDVSLKSLKNIIHRKEATGCLLKMQSHLIFKDLGEPCSIYIGI